MPATPRVSPEDIVELRPNPGVDPQLRYMQGQPYPVRLHMMRGIGPRPPRFLYKFRSLQPVESPADPAKPYRQSSLDRLRMSILDSLLYLSSPRGFNDPFDLGAYFTMEGTAQERVQRFTQFVKEQAPHLGFRRRAYEVRQFMKAPIEYHEKVFRQSTANQRAKMGVHSFAAGDPRDVLLWSHYAAEHAGFCLQFEPARDLLVLSRAISVDYIDDYPIINWIKNYRNAIGAMLTRKHSRWRYEDEYRILYEGQAGKYIRFRPEALTGIIFGCRAPDTLRGAVGEVLAERNALGLLRLRVFRAVQHPSRYDLIIRREH